MMLNMDTSIQYVKGVGEKRAALFARLDIHTVGDLLKHYPREYADWSNTVSIGDAPLDENVCIRAIAVSVPYEHRVRKGMVLYKFSVTDGETQMGITIFNNKYAAQKVKRGEEYLFFGKITGNRYGREMSSPQIEAVDGFDRLRPVYPQTAGLNSKAIEKVMKSAVDGLGNALGEDFLPEAFRKQYDLLDRKSAFLQIHFPDNLEQVAQARKRLVFEELLILQLGLFQLRGRAHSYTKAVVEEDYTNEFTGYLPFTLTGAQTRAIQDCLHDMQSGQAMSRLLQGDVGSGKTAVAAAIVYSLVKSGFQAAMMAPTEILAAQHAKTLSKILEPAGIRVGLLTAGCKAAEKREVQQQLANGSIGLVVGTQALLSDTTVFYNLGLVITDEQHRFGVHQRATLAAKGENPHMLVMSATPIPRTLALILYGDLDVSILDELPPGRKPVRTYAVGTDKRERI
ncbi:MAG: ATP-dependent DNA helicase RecG [Clostridia bacterium]|nr:ATP-dependent DNA helicase RecG [Clostridia bacterium]